jgi:tripartite ATP-independent transporter DctM subunit
MFGSFFVCLAIGVPLAWTMGGVGLLYGLITFGLNFAPMVMLRTLEMMNSFSLIAVPLFVYMGNILAKSGIADDLFQALHTWLGGLKGGLAAATIALCCVLAAMMGTVGADVTVTGLVCLPFMLRRGYDKHMALGAVTAGGALGVMIPPSIMFIIYGVTVGESIGKLYMGGILPGILLGALYIGYILIKSHVNPLAGPVAPIEDRRMPFIQKIGLIKHLIMPAALILLVMGSIFIGFATPSEAAGVGVVGSLICALVRKRLTFQSMKESLFATMKTVGLIMWVVFGAMVFVATYTFAGGQGFIESALLGLSENRWAVLLLTMVILIVMGMFLDTIGVTVLMAPIFVPLIRKLGFDPVWFGVLFNLNLQIGYLSPPFGYSIFYLKAVVPSDIQITDIYRGSFAYIILQVIGLILCTIFPQIILWLPGLMIQ